MLTDSITLLSTALIQNAHIEMGTNFPINPSPGRLFYLSVSVDNNDVGLYVYDGTAWRTGDITGVIAGTGLTGGGTVGSITLSLTDSGVVANTYKSVTVDTKGRVTAGTNPTTLAGYGITDAQPYDAQLSSLIPQNIQSTNYTTVLTDIGKHILHPSADTTARIFTIAANSSVTYSIGTALTFVNQNGAGVLTIAINSDILRLAGAGTTGNRTLAANGIATALKLTSTEWIISGTGLT